MISWRNEKFVIERVEEDDGRWVLEREGEEIMEMF
jgi:hypothetical protein